MSVSRRRFLSITAAAFACGGPVHAQPQSRWRGRALGAEADITIYGRTESESRAALIAARDTIRRMERLFSLYDPDSALSRLNRTGQLSMAPEFTRLVKIAGEVHRLTDGLFDPTVQPLFEAHLSAAGKPSRAEIMRIAGRLGWHRVRFDHKAIHLTAPDMALTFNGMAQGFATDRVRDVLAAHGFEKTLVNIGEYRAGDQPARIGIATETGDIIDQVALRNQSIATSSAQGFTFADGTGHILSPEARPHWATVSVSAETAAMADGLSTALILSPDEMLARKLRRQGVASAIWLLDSTGKRRKL